MKNLVLVLLSFITLVLLTGYTSLSLKYYKLDNNYTQLFLVNDTLMKECSKLQTSTEKLLKDYFICLGHGKLMTNNYVPDLSSGRYNSIDSIRVNEKPSVKRKRKKDKHINRGGAYYKKSKMKKKEKKHRKKCGKSRGNKRVF